MPRTDEPAPIPLRPVDRGLEGDSQERVALLLTLMTKFQLDAPAERAATAAAIAEALEALATGPELAPELRRLCARLQRIWLAPEMQQEPT